MELSTRSDKMTFSISLKKKKKQAAVTGQMVNNLHLYIAPFWQGAICKHELSLIIWPSEALRSIRLIVLMKGYGQDHQLTQISIMPFTEVYGATPV